MSNAVQLSFHWRTNDEVQAEVRANAVFIHAKLVAAGVDVTEARRAVQKLFSAGWQEGYEDGYDAGQSSALGGENCN
jgi:hypothetical protein